jgi:hypothetical protein
MRVYDSKYIDSYEALRQKIAGIDPNTLKMVGTGLAGAGLAGLGTYGVTKHFDEKKRLQTRNRAFGAGMATGIATPRLTQHLFNMARSTGFLPGGQ